MKTNDQDQNIMDEPEINANDLSFTEKRSLIFHLLYASDSYNYETTLDAIIENFAHGFNITISKDSFVYNSTLNIINNREELDKKIQPLLSNWRLERLGTVTRLITRQGIWELSCATVDFPIIINDYIDLAKCFAEKDAFRLVNGILDEYAKKENLVKPIK